MRATRAARQSIAAIPLVLYGYALCKAYSSAERAPVYFAHFAPVELLGLSTPLLAVLLAIVIRKFPEKPIRHIALAVGIVCQMTSFFLECADSLHLFQLEGFPSVLSFVVGSIGTVLISVLWIDLYSQLNPIRAAFANAFATLMSLAALYVIEGCSLDRQLAILFAIPLFSALCLLLSLRKGTNESHSENGKGARLIFPYKAVAFIAAYSFSYGAISALGFAEDSPYAAIVPALIIMVLVLIDPRRFSASMMFRVSFPLMSGGFLLVAIIPGLPHPASAFLLDVGFASMRMLLFLMVCTIAYSTGASAIWLFGVLGATQFFGRAAGVAIAGAIGKVAGSNEFVIVEAIATILVVVASFLLGTEKSLFSFWKPSAESRVETKEKEVADLLRSRIDFLAINYQLTDREKEMVSLVARGKTNAEIARETFISEGTVKVHLHHIYRKLGVHTRKELRSLIEERESD